MTTPTASLDQLRRQSADPGRRILLTGATVVTMDPQLGVLPKADLLIQDSTIAAIAPDLSSQGGTDGALVIDATGSILAPGFVDTHRHAWEAQLRRIMPDVNDLGEYVMSTLSGIAPTYQPQDMRALHAIAPSTPSMAPRPRGSAYTTSSISPPCKAPDRSGSARSPARSRPASRPTCSSFTPRT